MNVKKFDDNLVLLKDGAFYSVYEYKEGRLRESNAFFREDDAVLLLSEKLYITSFNGFQYVYWNNSCYLEMHKFVRLISKNKFKVYLEDETGDVWVLSVEPLDPDGDVRGMVLRLRKKGAS